MIQEESESTRSLFASIAKRDRASYDCAAAVLEVVVAELVGH